MRSLTHLMVNAEKSIPAQLHPSRSAMTKVVAQPQNGSSTQSPSLELALRMRSSKAKDFCVGSPCVLFLSVLWEYQETHRCSKSPCSYKSFPAFRRGELIFYTFCRLYPCGCIVSMSNLYKVKQSDGSSCFRFWNRAVKYRACGETVFWV